MFFCEEVNEWTLNLAAFQHQLMLRRMKRRSLLLPHTDLKRCDMHTNYAQVRGGHTKSIYFYELSFCLYLNINRPHTLSLLFILKTCFNSLRVRLGCVPNDSLQAGKRGLKVQTKAKHLTYFNLFLQMISSGQENGESKSKPRLNT